MVIFSDWQKCHFIIKYQGYRKEEQPLTRLETFTFTIAVLVLCITQPAHSHPPNGRIIGYMKPEKRQCTLKYSTVESPWLSNKLAWGVPLSVRYAASDDLTFGTKIYIPYYVRNRRGRLVKKTLYRIIGDHPRGHSRGIMIEPYINRKYEPFLRHILTGKQTVTIIRPIVSRRWLSAGPSQEGSCVSKIF